MTEIQKDFPKFLHLAEEEEIVVTDEGRPVGLLIGFEDHDEDWSDALLSDPRFLKRIADARESYRQGKFTRLEDIEW
jgi:antitoxin (DNA-binding transcriptional repressor) of toxin-antitoxin stability system